MNSLIKCVCFSKTKITNIRTLTRMSYFHSVGKIPLQYITLGNAFEKSALKYGDKTAIISMEDNREITFSQILKDCNKLTAGFQKLGLKIGDRVGLWAPNIIEWIITYIACTRAGLVTVFLNPVYNEDDMEYSINKVGIKTIVCPQLTKKINFYNTMRRLVPNLENSDPDKIHSTRVPSLKSIVTISNNTLKGTYNYNDVLNSADSTAIGNIRKIQNQIQPEALLNIQYTSGSTGRPKATCLGHFQLVNNSYLSGKLFGLDKYDHSLCVQVPFFHAFGMTIVQYCILFGSTLVLPSQTYNSESNLNALEEKRCTMIAGTPTMFIDLMNIQKQKNKKLFVKLIFIGGANCSPQLLKDIQNTFKADNLKIGYGLTEATAIMFQSTPLLEDEHKAFHTVGYVGEHLEVKVVDANDNIVPMGTPGEACVRGYSVMQGYYNDEEETKKVLKQNWLKTGDQIILQEDGYGRVVGRLKDMIIRGGENIFPSEIEEFLNGHPDIVECHVIGLSHDRLGEEVCACVKPKPGIHLNLESLREYCKGKLTEYKVPSQLRIVHNFPKTQTGKILKYVLKKQIEAN